MTAARLKYLTDMWLLCNVTRRKKALLSCLAGSLALTFGMLGCDFHCAYCQNWDISQAIRDPEAGTDPVKISADRVIDTAQERKAKLVVSSYNEPLITAEWSQDIFERARKKGFKTAFVSNGNATPEVLAFLRPHLDAYKVDLKSMRQENYRELGGKLSAVLDTIARLWERKVWVEVVTLVVPGFNDSDEELNGLAGFLASVSKDIPWHVTAFHKDYKMTGPKIPMPAHCSAPATSAKKPVSILSMQATCRAGWKNMKILFVLHAKMLVERVGYRIQQNLVTPDGKCRTAVRVCGIWS